MPRPARKILDATMLAPLFDSGPAALELEEKVSYLNDLRTVANPGDLDAEILRALASRDEALIELNTAVDRQQQMLKKLTAPSLHPALFLSVVEACDGIHAIVHAAGRDRVVGFREGIDPADLSGGDEVFLSEAGNCIVARSHAQRRGGELAAFVRAIGESRIVVRLHEEELMVHALPKIPLAELQAGDFIRIDRASFLAFEKVERAEDRQWLRADAPAASRADVGGQEECLERIIRALTERLVEPERAAKYGLRGRKSILMHGPPGCGKTLMARVAVAEVQRILGRPCKFVVVQPAEWESEWHSKSEANIRALFRTLRKTAEREGMVVCFIDEIDAVTRVRGGHLGVYNDKSLSALIAEIEGFNTLENVVLICATNRKDSIDPAALERLSAVDIPVPRPNLRAARAILGIHLPASLPFSPNGAAAQATREQVIDAVASRLFSPNADNAVCSIRFRDGKDRTIFAREMVSGRLLEQVCEDVRQSAFHGERDRAEAGLQIGDAIAAADGAIERLRTTLTIQNAHAWIGDLPQDVGVVAVERIGGKVKRGHRFLNT